MERPEVVRPLRLSWLVGSGRGGRDLTNRVNGSSVHMYRKLGEFKGGGINTISDREGKSKLHCS